MAAIVSLLSQRTSLLTLVCGPKSSGKSTFAKLLTNRILTKVDTARGVLVLDLDPGQPEYAPPGTLSLVQVKGLNLGVPFTHTDMASDAYTIIRAHTVAAITPASAPELFYECVMDLYNVYRRDFSTTPLIINTPGWILGTGLDLLTRVIKELSPSGVVYMSEDGPVDTVETLQSINAQQFSMLPSQRSESTGRTAAHFRSMQTMSYFHTVHNKESDRREESAWFSRSLWETPPLQIRYSGRRPGILGILSYGYEAPLNLLAEAINGMVLGAVEIEDAEAFRRLIPAEEPGPASKPRILRTPEDLPYISNPQGATLDPQHSCFIGLVLIRGIHTPSKALQVCTPIPVKRIQEAKSKGRNIVLVHGKFDMPTWAYTEHVYKESSGKQPDSEDDSEEGAQSAVKDVANIPWVEVLRKDEKRTAGSKALKVRRDLGKNSSN